MTIAADSFEHPDRIGTTRWTVSLLLNLALHGALLLIIMLRHVPIEPIGMPPAAVMIDLAPLPATNAPEPSATPPVTEPEVKTPPPEPQAQPLPLPESEAPKLEPSPAPHPPVALPAPQPPKPRPKRVEQPPSPRREPASAPASASAATAPPAEMARPSASQNTASSASNARVTWQAQLLAWLEKYKRYPRIAQEQRQQGVVYLRFTLNREGKVLSSQINKSSGFELLDDEVLALIQRAQPLPSPPAEVAADRIDLQVPVAFLLRR